MKNAALFAVSCVVALLLAEVAARLVLDPIDFLHAEYAPDPVLNHRIEPFAGGHDELGLRNKAGLRPAEILAIGDSMTYGMMATADESWPSHLQAITGRQVYNAGMGGYGPFRYLENRWLFRTASSGSEIDFHINYEFRNFALGLLMGAMFDRAFRKFTTAFEERAREIYGEA